MFMHCFVCFLRSKMCQHWVMSISNKWMIDRVGRCLKKTHTGMLQTITFLTCCGECPHNNKHHNYIFIFFPLFFHFFFLRFSDEIVCHDAEPQKFDNCQKKKMVNWNVPTSRNILQYYTIEWLFKWIMQSCGSINQHFGFSRDIHIKNEKAQSKEGKTNHLQNWVICKLCLGAILFFYRTSFFLAIFDRKYGCTTKWLNDSFGFIEITLWTTPIA